MIFKSRRQAGQLLAKELINFENDSNVIILGLPRGGIPVAYEIAKALNVNLDALLVRKLGVPGDEELAMGAVALGDIVYLNQDIIRQFGITESAIQKTIEKEQRVLSSRNLLYRQGKDEPDFIDKTIILVDDGLATGATMKAAINLIETQPFGEIIVAVPVAPESTCIELERDVDQVICLYNPEFFYGVGAWYEDFEQVSDEEVCSLLKASRH
jgi:predicted phosphoribosyltransferase